MTQLTPFTRFNTLNTFNSMIDDFFYPHFTRPISIDSEVLAKKENYSIWEMPNGKYEVRVQYSNENTTYHRATTRENLEDAKKYVEEQVTYHMKKIEGPKLVWSGEDDE